MIELQEEMIYRRLSFWDSSRSEQFTVVVVVTVSVYGGCLLLMSEIF